jgi:hypothetical protein
MNAQGRKLIAAIVMKLNAAKDDGLPLPELKAEVKHNVSILESMRDEEQEKYDNMPEGLQASSKGEALEQIIEMLDDVINDLESIDSADEDDDHEAVGQVLDTVIDNLEAI